MGLDHPHEPLLSDSFQPRARLEARHPKKFLKGRECPMDVFCTQGDPDKSKSTWISWDKYKQKNVLGMRHCFKTSKTANQPTSRCMHHRCIHNARGTKLKSVFSPASTLPETNIFAPENGWLEYDRFLLGWHIFMGYASLASIAGWHWWPESLKTIKKPKGKKQPCGLPRSMVQSRSVNEFDIE